MALIKCPVCEGTGLVSRPPDIPGDQPTWSSSGTCTYPCKVCQGTGMVSEEDFYYPLRSCLLRSPNEIGNRLIVLEQRIVHLEQRIVHLEQRIVHLEQRIVHLESLLKVYGIC